jgi:hypothetical protein
MHVQLSEDLGSVKQMLVLYNPAMLLTRPQSLVILDSLFGIEGKQRQIENKRQPVSVDQEQERQKSVYSGFWDNVCVETVAEINRVDVVATSYQQFVDL